MIGHKNGEPPAILPLMEVRQPDPDELTAMVSLAVECQRDPERHIAYVSAEESPLTVEIGEVDHWESYSMIAVEGTQVLGWMLAETDPHMGRVWWWGPFAVVGEAWGSVARAVYGAASELVAGFSEEEMVADARSRLLPAFAAAHGFHVEEGSALLSRRSDPPLDRDNGVAEAGEGHVVRLAALHDRLFPGTHTTGDRLVSLGGDRRDLLVVTVAGDVAGYIATELQHDGSLYIDYLGVDHRYRRRGLARRLVAEAVGRGFDRGATFAHLSVRESNAAARALYRSLRFQEDRVIHPFRKGFSLA